MKPYRCSQLRRFFAAPSFSRYFSTKRSSFWMLRERFCPASILALPLGMTWLAAPAAGQQTHGPVVIGTPVTPIVVTVKPPPPSQGEAVASQDEGRIIPEGEPLPVLPPVPHKPLIDPVFQQPVSKKDVPTTDAVSAPIVNVAGLFSKALPKTLFARPDFRMRKPF
jgi:hypothetical protein